MDNGKGEEVQAGINTSIMRRILDEYKYTRMPWGKYKGRFLKEIPDSYLIWAARAWQDQGVAMMFRVELARRKIKI